MNYDHIVGYDVQSDEGFGLVRSYGAVMQKVRLMAMTEYKVEHANLFVPMIKDEDGSYARPYISAQVEMQGMSLPDDGIAYVEMATKRKMPMVYQLSDNEIKALIERGFYSDGNIDYDMAYAMKDQQFTSPSIMTVYLGEGISNEDVPLRFVVLNDLEIMPESSPLARLTGQPSGISQVLATTMQLFDEADKEVKSGAEVNGSLIHTKRSLYIDRIRDFNEGVDLSTVPSSHDEAEALITSDDVSADVQVEDVKPEVKEELPFTVALDELELPKALSSVEHKELTREDEEHRELSELAGVDINELSTYSSYDDFNTDDDKEELVDQQVKEDVVEKLKDVNESEDERLKEEARLVARREEMLDDLDNLSTDEEDVNEERQKHEDVVEKLSKANKLEAIRAKQREDLHNQQNKSQDKQADGLER